MLFKKAKKLLTEPANTYFLITQPGEDEVDYYSMILEVPRPRETAFLRASGKAAFRTSDFGTLVYYGAGLLTEAEARQMVESLP